MPDNKALGMTDFEGIGYVPREWALTSMALCVTRAKEAWDEKTKQLHYDWKLQDPRWKIRHRNEGEWNKNALFKCIEIRILEHILHRYGISIQEGQKANWEGKFVPFWCELTDRYDNWREKQWEKAKKQRWPVVGRKDDYLDPSPAFPQSPYSTVPTIFAGYRGVGEGAEHPSVIATYRAASDRAYASAVYIQRERK